VTPAKWYRPRVPLGLVWVVCDDETPIGFATTEPFDDALHLWALAVRLEAQKRGAGRALVQAVIADARARGLPAVTLTTFRDIPWNGPFYASLGFVGVPQDGANPRLAGLRAHEAGLSLDVDRRCAMRLAL
jgi:GNAT superfamily N-acetyltransferase